MPIRQAVPPILLSVLLAPAIVDARSYNFTSAQQCRDTARSLYETSQNLGRMCSRDRECWSMGRNPLLFRQSEQASKDYNSVVETCRTMEGEERRLQNEAKARQDDFNRRQAEADRLQREQQNTSAAQVYQQQEKMRQETWARQRAAQEARRQPLVVPTTPPKPSGDETVNSFIGMVTGALTNKKNDDDDAPMTDQVYEQTKSVKTLTQKAMPEGNREVAKEVQEESLKELRRYQSAYEKEFNNASKQAEDVTPSAVAGSTPGPVFTPSTPAPRPVERSDNPWAASTTASSSPPFADKDSRAEDNPSEKNPWRDNVVEDSRRQTTTLPSNDTASINNSSMPGTRLTLTEESVTVTQAPSCKSPGGFKYKWKGIREGEFCYSNTGPNKAPVLCCPG